MEENSSEELLRKSVEHIHYEISMFRACVDFLGRFALKEVSTYEEGVIWNLYVEGVAMHTRVLHDFFYYENKKDDDILAKDFLNDTSWDLFKQKRTPKESFHDIVIKCNKQLAHLTMARVTQYSSPQDKGWNSKELSLMVDVTIEAFWDVLEDGRKKWFKDCPIVFVENNSLVHGV